MHDSNRDIIEEFNIFNHYGFWRNLKKNKEKNKEDFIIQLRKDDFYYFWSKAEYGLIIRIKDDKIFLLPWCGSKRPDLAKIDVTDNENFDWSGFAKYYIGREIFDKETKIDIKNQIDYMWHDFVDYVWDNRKEIKDEFK